MSDSPSQNGATHPQESNPLTVAESVGTIILLGLIIFLGLIIVLFHDSRIISLIWAGACLAAGGAAGFLFGIPKTQQKDSKAPQKVNTNLEDISDWLTKILVGLGLTQLQKIPAKLQELARYMAEGIGDTQTQRVFASGLIVYFTVVGFIAGYILTRLILAGLFRKADAGPLVKQAKELQIFASSDYRPNINIESRELHKFTSSDSSGTVSKDDKDKTGAADAVRATATILKAYDDLEKKQPKEALMPHIAELEALKTQFPLFRMLFIILGRLYRWTGRYDDAIRVLTQFIDTKKKDGSDGDDDTAAALYNRACYYAQEIDADTDDTEALASMAINDLKEAIVRKKDYALSAQTDPDLAPIRDRSDFKAPIG